MFYLSVLLLIAVYITVLWLAVKLGYGGLAELTRYGGTRLKVDPLVKLLALLTFFIVYSTIRLKFYSDTLLGFVLPLSFLALGVIALRDRVKPLLMYVGFYVVVTAWSTMNSIYYPGQGSPVLYVWPPFIVRVFHYYPVVSLRDVVIGLLSGLNDQVIYITMLGFIFISTTTTSEVMRSFSRLRVPLELTLIVAVFLKAIPQALRQMDDSFKLQLVRGLGYRKNVVLRPFYYIYAMLLVFLPAIVYLLRNSKSLAISLDTRAFRAMRGRTSVVREGLTWLDALLLAVCVLALVLAYVLQS